MTWNWARQPAKMWLGFMVLMSAHHFLNYARQVTHDLLQECEAFEQAQMSSSRQLET
jgi:hypothetical protein